MNRLYLVMRYVNPHPFFEDKFEINAPALKYLSLSPFCLTPIGPGNAKNFRTRLGSAIRFKLDLFNLELLAVLSTNLSNLELLDTYRCIKSFFHQLIIVI